MGHGENVPSDHYCSRYRERCEVCGRTYHASEGGCDCMDDADDCACGRNEWTRNLDDDIIRCASCESEPGAEPEETDDED